jgi:uncharacterized membrane protein YdfJ with MMPL/SSD domain
VTASVDMFPGALARRIASVCGRSPLAVIVLAAVLAVALGAYATTVPDRMALGGGSLGGSESERLADELADELGYQPQAAFQVALTAREAIPPAAEGVAIRVVASQIQAIEGVGEVIEAEAAAGAELTALAVHLSADADAETTAAVSDGLETKLDPGPLELSVGGGVPVQEGARQAALDDAPKLTALVLPLVLLLLAGSLGLRAGMVALLAALLAAAVVVAVLGLLDAVVELQAVAVPLAVLVAATLAIEFAAGLLFRYREESATLGAGAEALEYSLHTMLKAAAIATASAGLVGVALLAIDVEFVRSGGAALLAATLISPLLGLVPMSAALVLRAEAEVGEALPLVADAATVDDAPRGFAALLALGRARARGLVALLPVLAIAVLALPLLDAEAVGLDAAELPANDPAAEAGAGIAAAFGAGATGPLLVAVEGATAEVPTVTIYRDRISRLDGVDAVGRAATVGDFASFQAVPAGRPMSLAAQGAVDDVRALPAPAASSVGGPAAELRDAGGGIGSALPLAGLFALLGAAALWSLLFRSVYGPLLALAALIAPLAGLAAVVGVFSEGNLTGLLDYRPSGAPHLQTFALVGAGLLALGLARGAELATALREERLLGGGAAGSLARSNLLTLMPIAVATGAGFAIAGVWVGSDLLPAKELAVGFGLGLLADLALARTVLAPALARLGL